jgi:hypothetical protein
MPSPSCDSSVASTVASDDGTIIHQGWLCKEGGLVKNWKWRWCVLILGKLEYYSDPQATKPRGSIAMPLGTVILPIKHDRAPKGRQCLTIQRPQPARSYFLQAATPAEFLEWLDALKLALPRKVRRLTNLAIQEYQAQVLGCEGTSRAESMLQSALQRMLVRDAPSNTGDEERGSPPRDGNIAIPNNESEVITRAHTHLFAMDKDERDEKVQDALATLVAATCPTVRHVVELYWDDTAFPLGLDFQTLNGGQIAVKHVFGGARSQSVDIQTGDIVVALNSESVQGISLDGFFDRIQQLAPGSSPCKYNHKSCDPNPKNHIKSNSTGAISFRAKTKYSRRKHTPVCVKVSFTLARKLAKEPPSYSLWRQGDKLPSKILADEIANAANLRKSQSMPDMAIFDSFDCV